MAFWLELTNQSGMVLLRMPSLGKAKPTQPSSQELTKENTTKAQGCYVEVAQKMVKLGATFLFESLQNPATQLLAGVPSSFAATLGFKR